MRWLQSGLLPATARESETDRRMRARSETGFSRLSARVWPHPSIADVALHRFVVIDRKAT